MCSLSGLIIKQITVLGLSSKALVAGMVETSSVSSGANANQQKMDSPPGKAELINGGGKTSGITSLGEGNLLCNSSWERGVRIYERNNSVREYPGWVREVGEEVLQMLEQRLPCSHPWWSRYSHAASGEHHSEVGGCPKEAVTSSGAHTGAGSCQDLRPHEERSTNWSRFTGGTCGGSHWSSLFLAAGTHTGAVYEELQPVGGTPHLEDENMRRKEQ